MLFMIYKSTCNLYHFIISKYIVYLGHKCTLKPFKSSFNAISKAEVQMIYLLYPAYNFFNFLFKLLLDTQNFFWTTWTFLLRKIITIILYDCVLFTHLHVTIFEEGLYSRLQQLRAKELVMHLKWKIQNNIFTHHPALTTKWIR